MNAPSTHTFDASYIRDGVGIALFTSQMTIQVRAYHLQPRAAARPPIQQSVNPLRSPFIVHLTITRPSQGNRTHCIRFQRRFKTALHLNRPTHQGDVQS